MKEQKIKYSAYKTIISVFVLLFSQYVIAQSPQVLFQSEESHAKVLSNDHQSTEISFSFQGLNYNTIETQKGTFTELVIPMGYSTGESGTPKLPAAKKLIEIPFGAEVSVAVSSYTTEEYKLTDYSIKNPLMPVQPSVRRDIETKDIPFEYNQEYYTKTSYIEPELAQVEVLGVMRGMRLARLTVAPVHYNPSKGTIKVYNNLDLQIQYQGSDIDLTNYIKSSTYSPYFDALYSSIINPLEKSDVFEEFPDITRYPVKMIVISHPDFEETLQPFIEWKTIQGFDIIEAYTDEIGNTPGEIKDYISHHYNAAAPGNPAPSFIVLVGDNNKLPASATGSKTGKVTDLYYASVDGDYFPDMYLGRLSARNNQELKNQIDKILYYQKYEFKDPSYLDNATLIAGADNKWNPRVGQPTINYGTENYFNVANGFADINTYLDSYSGCYDNERISVSFINYTAHCSPTSWSDPQLSVSNIHEMNNAGKYPLAVGNCCESALFSSSESIGEAWVRAENKGAVAYIGSAPNTYWFEDFYWSVGAFPMEGENNGYVPTFEETTLGAFDAPFVSDYITVAAKKFVGNLAVTEAHLQGYNTQSNTRYYWEAYHTLGDPSTMIYMTQGSENQVNYMDYIPVGSDEFLIEALPGSYVALSLDGILLGAAFVSETGKVNVPVDQIDQGPVKIVVTKSQHIPYINNIPVIKPDEPLITLDSYEIDDQTGNNNGQVDYGETISLNITAKNFGDENATNVNGNLSVDDPYYTITDSTAYFNEILAGDNNTTTVENAFTFEVADNVPDQHTTSFDITFSDDDNNQWFSSLTIKANAPVLVFEKLLIDEIKENTPGVLRPGDTADLNITIKNTGHSLSKNVEVSIEDPGPWIKINKGDTVIDPLKPGESAEIIFNITVDEDTPLEESIELNYLATTGEYFFEDERVIIIGTLPIFTMGETDTVVACDGKFYDSGGPNNNYSNDEDVVMTFLPSHPGYALEFEFLSFKTEDHEDCLWDYLKIYNGRDTTAELIGKYCGNNSPETILAKNSKGALTFHFVSDESITRQGWEAKFHCVDISQPPPCAENPFPKNEAENIEILPGNKLQWDPVPGAFGYYVLFSEQYLPDEYIADVNDPFFEIDIEPYSEYSWKIIPYNSSGDAAECPQWSFSTGDVAETVIMSNDSISTCNALFYDSGGPGMNYSNNEDYTITFYPTTANAQVEVEFTSFEIEEHDDCDWDWLKIYNGENTSAELTGTFCGTNSPGIVTADNDQGALTFRFFSDGSVTREGWSANVYCVFEDDVYSAFFDVYDENDNKINNAVITTNNTEYKPGQYEIKYLTAGNYNFTVSKDGYKDYQGEFEIINSDAEMPVIMERDEAIIDETNNLADMVVYPNPTNSIVNVKMNIQSQNSQLYLMNHHGQIIKNKHYTELIKGSITRFNLGDLPPGIYYLKLETTNDSYIRKIVLQ